MISLARAVSLDPRPHAGGGGPGVSPRAGAAYPTGRKERMAKIEPTPQGVFSHLWTGAEHTVMANRAGLHKFLMDTAGTIIVGGCLRRVTSKLLGDESFHVNSDLKSPAARMSAD